MNVIPRNLETSCHWRQYDAVTQDIDLAADRGALPRRIVMLEAGDLVVTDAVGRDAWLLDLPAGYVHDGACRYLRAGHDARIVVYW